MNIVIQEINVADICFQFFSFNCILFVSRRWVSFFTLKPREERLDCINSLHWHSLSPSHLSPAQSMTTIDPFSFAQDKWPYYHRGPFKIGSCQAWQNRLWENTDLLREPWCALFLRETIKSTFYRPNEFSELSTHQEAHPEPPVDWEQCQLLCNLILSRRLWKSTF